VRVVAVFRRSWQVTLTWQSASDSPTGQPIQMIDVATVAELRAVVRAALANPLVQTYSYRVHREWVGDSSPPTCRRGHELPPARYGASDCLCGIGHFRSHCVCGDVQHIPPLGPGCGPVPFDPDADKHHW